MLTLSSLGLTSKLCTTRGQARNSRSVKQSLIRLRVQQGLFKYQYFRRTLQKIHRCEFWRLQQLCFRLRLDQFGEDFHDEGQRSNWRSDPAECAVFIRQNQGVNVVRLRNKTVLHRSIRSLTRFTWNKFLTCCRAKASLRWKFGNRIKTSSSRVWLSKWLQTTRKQSNCSISESRCGGTETPTWTTTPAGRTPYSDSTWK